MARCDLLSVLRDQRSSSTSMNAEFLEVGSTVAVLRDQLSSLTSMNAELLLLG